MPKTTVIYPSKYNLHSDELDFTKLPQEAIPIAYATLDGKPSEQYEKGKPYFAGSLVTNMPFMYEAVYQRLTDFFGKPLVKASKKKRGNVRLKYLREVIDGFIKIQSELNGFPLNFASIPGTKNSLNPSTSLEMYRASTEMQKKISITEITDRHVRFGGEGWNESVTHEQFGGIIFWTDIVAEIDKYISFLNGIPASWILLADRLPSDVAGSRMAILAEMLQERFNSRIYVQYTELQPGEEDLPHDLLTDLYTAIVYELFAPDGSKDPSLLEAFITLQNGAKSHHIVSMNPV